MTLCLSGSVRVKADDIFNQHTLTMLPAVILMVQSGN
jgi:hypothetical protein